MSETLYIDYIELSRKVNGVQLSLLIDQILLFIIQYKVNIFTNLSNIFQKRIVINVIITVQEKLRLLKIQKSVKNYLVMIQNIIIFLKKNV